RPAISRGPCRQPAPAEVVHCCVRDHDQGHNLECAERSSERQCDSGRSTEIEMMSSADDAAGQINDCRKKRCLRRHSWPDEFQSRKEERNDGSRKDFKKTFNPKVYDPPAPIFDERQVAMLSPCQSCAVKQSNGAGRKQEQPEERPMFFFVLKGR